MDRIASVVKAEYRGGYRIHVTFDDHSEKTIDSRRWLKGPVFEPLKAPRYFRRFFLDGCNTGLKCLPMRPANCVNASILFWPAIGLRLCQNDPTGASERRRAEQAAPPGARVSTSV